jgi:hypothetical protein
MIEKKWFGGKKTGCWLWIEYNEDGIEVKKHFKEPVHLIREIKLNKIL